MARNVEIKARLHDYTATRARVAAIAEEPPRLIEQYDTFFNCTTGRLKLRRFADGSGQLIAYSRADTTGPETSEYHIAEVPEPDATSRVLETANGVAGVVEKRRELFMVGRTRIHLDRVDGLGAFLELEVVLAAGESSTNGRRDAEGLMARLGIGEADLVEVAYIDLLGRRSS